MPAWQVDCRSWRKTAQLAKEGAITGLKLLIVDVQMAPKDGKRRWASPGADFDALCGPLFRPPACTEMLACPRSDYIIAFDTQLAQASSHELSNRTTQDIFEADTSALSFRRLTCHF